MDHPRNFDSQTQRKKRKRETVISACKQRIMGSVAVYWLERKQMSDWWYRKGKLVTIEA